MKHLKLMLIICVFIPFLACENEDNIVETNLDLVVDVPFQAVLLENLNAEKSSLVNQYSFTGDAIFCLAAHGGFKNCPGSILGVIPGNGANLTFVGLTGLNEVQSLTLEWGYTPAGTVNFHMQQAVELLSAGDKINPSKLSVNLDEVLAPVIQQMDNNPRNLIFFHIKGTANFNASVSASLNVPVVVRSEETSPRFTL